jgi:hypothetical protein
MTPALAERASASPDRADAARVAPSGGRLTLDELMSSAWAGVTAGVPVACPVCGERMAPAGPDVATCRSCASILS